MGDESERGKDEAEEKLGMLRYEGIRGEREAVW